MKRRELLKTAAILPIGGLATLDASAEQPVTGGLTPEQDVMLRKVYEMLYTGTLTVDVGSMNGHPLLGAGTSGDRWRGNET